MKSLLSLLILSAISATALADIQDPPMNDYGPTRKLGRGLSNLLWGFSEFTDTVCKINDREGNAAAASYGLVKGVGRVFARAGFGIYEVLTWPIPTTRSSYRPPYKSNVPWIHGGYEEFPPELGFETKYKYVRSDYGW